MTAITIDQDLTVPQVLTGAKSLLLTAGWITDEMRSRYGYCIAGAVRFSAYNSTEDDRGPDSVAVVAIDLLADALVARGVPTTDATMHLQYVTSWNDHRCKDVGDAVALIDEALLLAASRSRLTVRRSHSIKSLFVRRHDIPVSTVATEVPELVSVG